METRKAGFETIDDYHALVPAEVRRLLDILRKAIRSAAPDAEEVISYNMPGFRWNGMLVWYAANKHHIGFYPSASPLVVFKDELTPYKTSKGAIQFPLDRPIPVALVKKIVKYRIAENLEKQQLKNTTAPRRTRR